MVISEKNKMQKFTDKWITTSIGHACDIARGGSPRPIQHYITNSPDGINWIKIGDVSPSSKYIESTKERIIPEGKKYSREVFKGDFILSNSMSFGRPYIVNIYGCIHDGWLVLQNYHEIFHTEFLYYILSSDDVMRQFITIATGSGVHNLNKELVSEVVITYPQNLTEQKAIASVLTNLDNLIDSLEKLISKKRLIKEGVMQDLLTGKNRLPKFEGKWVSTCLGKLGELKRESVLPTDYPNKLYSEYSMPAFDLNKKPELVFGKEIQSSKTKIKGEILLFNKLNVHQRRVWYVNNCPDSSICSSEFLAYYSDNINLKYLGYLLSCNKVTAEFVSQSSGSSNSQKRISPHIFLDYIISYPADLNEQVAIVKVLTNMDNEITALEEKLAKYMQIKTGAMQQLLTGKIRLPME